MKKEERILKFFSFYDFWTKEGVPYKEVQKIDLV